MVVEDTYDMRWYNVTGPLDDLHDSAINRTLWVGGAHDATMMKIMEAAESQDTDKLMQLLEGLSLEDLKWQLCKQAQLAAHYRVLGLNAIEAVSLVKYPELHESEIDADPSEN